VKDTYFTGMLGSGKSKSESDGSYFIGRNPKGFAHVLDLLRTGILDLDVRFTPSSSGFGELQ